MARVASNSGKRKSEDLSIKVVIGPCRMSFPHFFEPQETDGGDRYQANFLFPPNWKKQPDFKKFEDALYQCMEDKFGDERDWPNGRNDRGPDQVVRKAEEKDYEGYKPGWFFLKAASRDPVGIVDANREEVTNPREIYGGRWCRISVTVKAYDNKSKGVGVYLNSVQVLDHDEPFGGRGPARNDFEDWGGDALSDDDRGTGRGNARPKDDDRDDRDDRGSRGAGRGRDRDDRGSRDDRDDRGSRSRRDDRDDDRSDDRRGSGRSRREDPEDDAPRGRGRDRDDRGTRDDRDDDRGSRRSRGRDDADDRSRDRDDDNRGNRGGRRQDADDDRGSRRGARDDDRGDDRPSRRSARDDDDADDRGSRGRSSRRGGDDDAGEDDTRSSRRGGSRGRADDDGWN